MSEQGDLERDIAEEDETRSLLQGGDQDLVAPAFAVVEQRAAQRRSFSSIGALAVAALVLAVIVGFASWRGSLPVAAPSIAPRPTATTLAYPGSPCQSVTVGEQRFEDSVPPTRANPTPTTFTGDHFLGIGRVVSIAADSSSVVLELVNPLMFDAYGATTVKITPQTSFDHVETQWALVGASGVAAGATQLPLAPGAPGVDAGQRIFVQCMIDNHGTGGGSVTASSAPPGATAWMLNQPLQLAFPAGTLVSYDRTIHVARFVDLGVSVGQSVDVEFAGTPGNYSATHLTNVIPIYGWPPSPTPTANTTTAPVPTVSPTAGSATGVITGRLGYPSDFIPALTVYAISVNDPNVFFSVDFAGFGNPPRPTLPPGVSQPTYTLTGVAPGTYHVLAYRNDGSPGIGVYSQHTVNCLQATQGGQFSTPAPACAANDHSLLAVTVHAGETLNRIDITDWVFQPDHYPLRPR